MDDMERQEQDRDAAAVAREMYNPDGTLREGFLEAHDYDPRQVTYGRTRW